MPKGTKPDYQTLVKALEDQCEPSNQAEFCTAQMHEQRQRAGEFLPELGHAIFWLANLA
jgi:hypothetical protein